MVIGLFGAFAVRLFHLPPTLVSVGTLLLLLVVGLWPTSWKVPRGPTVRSSRQERRVAGRPTCRQHRQRAGTAMSRNARAFEGYDDLTCTPAPLGSAGVGVRRVRALCRGSDCGDGRRPKGSGASSGVVGQHRAGRGSRCTGGSGHVLSIIRTLGSGHGRSRRLVDAAGVDQQGAGHRALLPMPNRPVPLFAL